TAALYWSADTTFDPSDTLIPGSVTTTQTAVGTYGPIRVDAANLGTPPTGTKYLLDVVDPDNTVAESDEPNYPSDFGANNVQSLALPQEFQIKFMTFIPGVGGNYIQGPFFHPESYCDPVVAAYELYVLHRIPQLTGLLAFAGDGRLFDPSAISQQA